MARLNTTLGDLDVQRLEEIKEATKLDQNDAIRKALATEAFVQQSIRKGAKLLLEMPDGTIKQIEFVG